MDTKIEDLPNLTDLPDHELFSLVRYLTPEGIDEFCTTNNVLKKRICQNEDFWQFKYVFDFGEIPTPKSWKSAYLKAYFGPKNWIFTETDKFKPCFWGEYFGGLMNDTLMLFWDIKYYQYGDFTNKDWIYGLNLNPDKSVKFDIHVYIVITSPKYLVGISQNGEIEVHTWGSDKVQRYGTQLDIQDLDIDMFIRNDYLIFDLKNNNRAINIVFNLEKGTYNGHFEYNPDDEYITYLLNYALIHTIGDNSKMNLVDLDDFSEFELDMTNYREDWSYGGIDGVENTHILIFDNDNGTFIGYNFLQGRDIWKVTYNTKWVHDLGNGYLLFRDQNRKDAMVIKAETGQILYTFDNYPSKIITPIHTPTRSKYILSHFDLSSSC